MPIAFLGIASRKIGENYKCEFVRECGKQRRFETAEFSDSQLADIAKKYIDGLNLQKEALSAAHVWEAQVKWQEGLVYRLEALKALYNDYDFLADNKEDFVCCRLHINIRSRGIPPTGVKFPGG